ncbi:ead/Ea22-like family protein [Enterobacter ludwigii]|uniref:ead/Ea22-like family protein n=1 Tax=Enterobacter ludwigii TaxID=299767 RepID=UPI001CC30695|nr:ead/Ea22-like family protein [Enterobacter ludwigii]
MKFNKQELRKAAEKATEGNYVVGHCDINKHGNLSSVYVCQEWNGMAGGVVAECHVNCLTKNSDQVYANAGFMALASPANVISLLEEISTLESRCAELAAENAGLKEACGGGEPTVYACDGYEADPENPGMVRRAAGRDIADKHYEESRYIGWKKGGDSDVVALLDELEAAQIYAKDRDEENQDLMLTVGRLRVELEASEAELGNALCELLPGVQYMDPPDGGSVTPLEQVSRMVADYREQIQAAEKRIAELEAREVRLTDINEYLAEVHDKTLNRAFRLLAEGVRAGDVAAMRAAGINVAAAGKGEAS